MVLLRMNLVINLAVKSKWIRICLRGPFPYQLFSEANVNISLLILCHVTGPTIQFIGFWSHIMLFEGKWVFIFYQNCQTINCDLVA